MSTQQSTDRILTTHVGSLPRPHDLLDLMQAKLTGRDYDRDGYAARVRAAVAESVRNQSAAGIDIVNDGEQWKSGFYTYIGERLEGFEPAPHYPQPTWPLEVAAFPEYYERYFKEAMMGGAVAAVVPLVCTGPVRYRGEEALRRDIENLKLAAAAVPHHAVFMASVAPSGVGFNEYYASDEEFLYAVAAALRVEYQTIVDAGLLLQIDDPFLTDIFANPSLTAAERDVRARLFVEGVNESIRGLPPEQIRFHTCYGINEGPRVHDVDFSELVQYVLSVNAAGYSFEAANPRHEHEYHVWERVKLPDGKVLIPGVITHASNIVEHPQWIAERIVRFARLVGRENVVAGADCGFSSQATYRPEVDPRVIWAKFEALRDGARRATRELWRS
jgi:5-methyltetrahydropteroyltriglutamate--homocysteine methyltransferase